MNPNQFYFHLEFSFNETLYDIELWLDSIGILNLQSNSFDE